jgi:hypothetical protein
VKKTRVLVNLIASWQLLFALTLLFGEIVRIQNMSWERQSDIPTFGIHYFQGIDRIYWNWADTLIAVFVIFGFIIILGLFMKKNWARILNIVPSIGIVIFGFWIMWLAFIEYPSTDLFLDIILPILIFLILALTGGISTIYLTRAHVKEYFLKTTD